MAVLIAFALFLTSNYNTFQKFSPAARRISPKIFACGMQDHSKNIRLRRAGFMIVSRASTDWFS